MKHVHQRSAKVAAKEVFVIIWLQITRTRRSKSCIAKCNIGMIQLEVIIGYKNIIKSDQTFLSEGSSDKLVRMH